MLNFQRHLKFVSTISQMIDSKFDLKKKCENYPNDKFGMYKDCDDDFVLQEVLKIGLIPFWATKNFSSVTKHRNHID